MIASPAIWATTRYAGGSGTDTVDYSGSIPEEGSWTENALPVRVDLQRQRATGVGLDTMSSVEGVIGGANRDVLLGSRGRQHLLASHLPWGRR